MLLSLKKLTHAMRVGVGIALAFLCWDNATNLYGEEVSRKVPPIYREKLMSLLTPIEEVIRSAAATRDSESDGAVLLDEEIHYIDEKGRRFFVDHRVNKALNDTGAKENAEETHHYRKANQKIHLISAQTILPDGKRMPIRPGAAILQSPQRQADYSLYDDQGELRLIFPNMKPGAITESIVLVEENQFRIPGEFTAVYTWAFDWPASKIRRTVEMPVALADRLKTFPTGHRVPDAEKIQVAKGRTRFTWQSSDLDLLPNERNRPPTQQAGPVLRLTTLPDWEALVKWYAPLVQEKSKLQPGLGKQVDEWTKDAKNSAEILEILLTRVARDVRYTGLEFGASDLQPHDCNEVWENQYGDCKDKANLLRTMLQRKGIASHLVLLNTEHAGLIDRRCPDYRQFNHAIVAVEREPGQYVFCDPTISFAKAGLLSPTDADRDVLLIRNGGAEWAHTPPQDAGLLQYDLDLKLAANGEISGWVTQETSGYYGASDAGAYQGLDKDRIRESARNMVRGFFKGAEIVDVTRTPLDHWTGNYQVKAYFLLPGSNQEGQGRSSLSFPQSSSLFVDPGLQKKRETPFYTWPDTVKVTARFKLSEGCTPMNLPRPFQVGSKSLDGAAKWSVEGGELHAMLEVKIKQSLVPADEFEVFYNALQSLHAWIDNPLAMTLVEGKAPAPAAPSVTLEDFPMMPNGDGQLALLDQRFPASRDPELRREALQKVMQYFPTDKSTLFSAKLKLAVMDLKDEKAQEAVQQIENLLRTYKDGIGVDDVAWGQYVMALGLKDLQKDAESMKELERIGANRAVMPYWRAWSAYQRAKILEEKSPTSAIKAVRESLALDTDAQPAAFTLLAKLLVVDGRMADLKKEVRQLLDKKPSQFAAMLTRLAESAGELLPADKATQREELMQILDDAQKSVDLGKRFAEALQSSRDAIRTITSANLIRENLKKYLAKNPSGDLESAATKSRTRVEFAEAVERGVKERKPDLSLGSGLALLTRFEPDGDFAGYLWRATSHADWKERMQNTPEPLLPVLLDLCDLLAPDNDTYVDGKLLRARGFQRRGDIEGARKIHEEVLRIPSLTPGFKVTTRVRLAGNLEEQRDYARALEVYREIETQIEFASAKDALLRAAFLHLEMGARDEALRILTALAGRKEDAVKQASTGAQILELAALVKEPRNAAAYWDASAKWWPKWIELEGKLGMKPRGDEQIILAIPDLQDFGSDAGVALRGKDRDAFCRALRTLAHAARWQPSMSIELFSLMIYAPGLIPDRAEDIRKFVVATSDQFTSDRHDLIRKNQMYGTIACIDTTQYARALEIIHAFNQEPPADDETAHSMARLWAITVQTEKGDLAPAILALERAVGSPNLSEPGLTVTSLANLYRQANRPDDEEKLLKREIENPRIKAVPADLQALTSRYQRLTEDGEGSRKLTAAIDHWLKRQKPAWFDFAEPQTLDDPRLSNLDEVLKNPERIFTEPEIIKLQILVAGSSPQPYERRQREFLGALYRLMSQTQTTEQAQTIYDPIVDDEDFPEWLRVEVLWCATVNARSDKRAGDFEKFATHPLTKKYNENTKASLGFLREAMAVDMNSVPRITEFCARILEKEITFTSLGEFRVFYSRLLARGEIEAAEKIYRRWSDARIAADLQTTKASLQMEFLKWLNYTKRWAPFDAAAREIVLARYPAETIEEPEIYAKLHNRLRLDWLDEDTARQVFLFQLKTWQLAPGDLRPWGDFVQNLPRNEVSRKLALDIIAAALRHAPGDSERAMAVGFATSSVDGDDLDLRTALADLLRPYRKAEEFPLTYTEIRQNELHGAVRRGESIDFESDFANLKVSSAAAMGNFVKLRYYIQNRKILPLRKTLEAMSSDELLGDQLLTLSLRAFALTGMNDELEVAREAGKKAIYRNVLQSWMSLNRYAFARSFDLAEAMDDRSGLPPQWLTSSLAGLKNERLRFSILCEDSHLRKDWPRLLETAEKAIPAYPTYYHFHWFKGAALYRLDRKQEALEPLRIYTRYAKDEHEYPQAVEWLNALKADGTDGKSTPP